MKKTIGIIFVITGLLLGFGCNSAEKEAAKKEAEKIEKEIITNDSLSTQMESVKNEIDNSVKELDELLNEL